MINFVKGIKHKFFIIKKYRVPQVKNLYFKIFYKRYEYTPELYRVKVGGVTMPSSSTFLVNHTLFAQNKKFDGHGEAPYRIFLIWFGGEMSKNRRLGIESIKNANPNLDIQIITNDNMDSFVRDEHPLPPSFNYLSFVHRSDYFRAYLMHYYGGVYSDIKPLDIQWRGLIDELNKTDLFAIGPGETTFENVAEAPGVGKLGKDQKHYYWQTLYPACYACKPKTPFTYEQLAEIERRLSYFYNLLVENPAEQPWGNNSNYPIPWNAIHGQIWSPLNLKYFDKIKAYPGLINNFGPHR